jgi:hypothetical protein
MHGELFLCLAGHGYQGYQLNPHGWKVQAGGL